MHPIFNSFHSNLFLQQYVPCVYPQCLAGHQTCACICADKGDLPCQNMTLLTQLDPANEHKCLELNSLHSHLISQLGQVLPRHHQLSFLQTLLMPTCDISHEHECHISWGSYYKVSENCASMIHQESIVWFPPCAGLPPALPFWVYVRTKIGI